MTKYPFHWCTGGRNGKQFHRHKIKPGEDLCMLLPEIHTVNFFFRAHLDVANDLIFAGCVMVCFFLGTLLAVAREKPWSFSGYWWLLLIFSTAALRYGDFLSLNQEKV